VPSLLIAPLAIYHAREAARLHIQGQPGTFLTSLGEDVLTVIYRALPQSHDGFGYAAVRTPALQEESAQLTAGAPLGGYVSATTGIGGLFVEIGSKRLGELLPPLLRRYRQAPQLALRSVQTALYPLLMHEGEGHEPTAELLSIMVEPPLRSHGVGALLMAAFLQECRSRGLAAVTVTVDAANAGAQRFYRRHGFEAGRAIKLYGRSMIIYRRSILAET
jgi:ribosomal protein S18 acetylase RimI-like enzyme